MLPFGPKRKERPTRVNFFHTSSKHTGNIHNHLKLQRAVATTLAGYNNFCISINQALFIYFAGQPPHKTHASWAYTLFLGWTIRSLPKRVYLLGSHWLIMIGLIKIGQAWSGSLLTPPGVPKDPRDLPTYFNRYHSIVNQYAGDLLSFSLFLTRSMVVRISHC